MQNKSIVVLISGNGSNLQAFIDAQNEADFKGEIVAVISNKDTAFGLTRAKNANIPALSIQHTDYPTRESFDQALAQQIEQYKPDLIILAGFMRILTADFVTKFRGKLLNIHPSLLPKYPGLHTHKKALENNDEFHGSSVHFVTEELDGGPVISQAKASVKKQDSEATLTKRIQKLEHQLYPKSANLLLTGKIVLKQDDIYFENGKLEEPITF